MHVIQLRATNAQMRLEEIRFQITSYVGSMVDKYVYRSPAQCGQFIRMRCLSSLQIRRL